MKKSAIPKPRYGLGDAVIFTLPSEGNYPPRRLISTIESVEIKITGSGHSIRYGLKDQDDTLDESAVQRRAIACQTP